MNELKLALFKRPGGVLQGVITSVDKPLDHSLNGLEYEQKFRRMLEAFSPYARLDLIITSNGGVVASAFGLMQAVLKMKRPTRVLVDGRCDSAASLLLCVADEHQVMITPNSSIFIHMPRRIARKKVAGIWKFFAMQNDLATVNMMISAYRARLHWSRRAIRQMMTETRRFSAKEAVDCGLCDAICERWVFEP